MITKNTLNLKNKIIDILKVTIIKIPIDKKDDKIVYDEQPFISDKQDGKVVKIKNGKKPLYGEEYTKESETGLEKIAEIIVNEVLSYIVENANVNLKERLDTLEEDYNKLLIALNTAALSLSSTPILVPVANALANISGVGGGIFRADKTTKLKQANEQTEIG